MCCSVDRAFTVILITVLHFRRLSFGVPNPSPSFARRVGPYHSIRPHQRCKCCSDNASLLCGGHRTPLGPTLQLDPPRINEWKKTNWFSFKHCHEAAEKRSHNSLNKFDWLVQTYGDHAPRNQVCLCLVHENNSLCPRGGGGGGGV